MALRQLITAMGVAMVATLGGCGVIYTNPTVSEGAGLGTAEDALDVSVIGLTYETTAAANLDPYVPSRLPLGFQPDAAAKIVGKSFSVPQLGGVPRPPSQPSPRPGFIPDNLPPIEAPQPYVIGVADVLLLSVNAADATVDQLPGLISAQSKRQGFVVQDDGAIAIPDAGRIQVAGLTMQDAEAMIFQALVTAGIDPAFSLEIAEFNSQRVSVGGEVRAPALVPITLKPLYLHEAVNSAGGLAIDDARVAKVQLFRDGTTYQVSANRFQSDPIIRQIVLREGDSIFVTSDYRDDQARARFEQQISVLQLQQNAITAAVQSANIRSQTANLELSKLEAERAAFKDRLELGAVKRDYAYIAGEVGTPNRFALPFETKAVLADVLFSGEARGLNINFADYGEIYVLRRSTNPEEFSRVTAYHLNADNAANLALASAFEMHAGDVVFVAEQPVTAWNRALTQLFPTLLFTAANAANNF